MQVITLNMTAETPELTFSNVGIPGPQGEKGDKGDRGENLKFSDLTSAEKMQIKGEKGDKGDQGDKGDSIKGDKGDKGEKGEKGDQLTYADLTPDNKADLSQVAVDAVYPYLTAVESTASDVSKLHDEATTAAQEAKLANAEAKQASTAAVTAADDITAKASTVNTQYASVMAASTAVQEARDVAVASSDTARNYASQATSMAATCASYAQETESDRTATATARDEAVAAAAQLTGQLTYRGLWDASSGNYPAVPTTSSFWKVTVPGTISGVVFKLGDQIEYRIPNGPFERVPASAPVLSVNTKEGAVVLTASDVGAKPASYVPSWGEVTAKPSTFAPSAHQHPWNDISGKPSTFATTWADVANKPTFATRWPSWTEVGSKPSTFPPATHQHAWADLLNVPSYASRWPTAAEAGASPVELTYAVKIGSGQQAGNEVLETYLGINTQNGGRMLIGSGECLPLLINEAGTMANEEMHLGSDNTVTIHTGLQGGWNTPNHGILMAQNGEWYVGNGTYRSYSELYKPTPDAIGAAPASHGHSWGQLTGVPVYATRWPTAAEAGALPASTKAWDISGATQKTIMGRQGEGLRYLRVASVPTQVYSGSSGFSVLVSGGNDFGGPSIQSFIISGSSRGYSSGLPSPAQMQVTALNAVVPGVGFGIVSNTDRGTLDYYMELPSYSHQVTVIPLFSDLNSFTEFPDGAYGDTKPAGWVQVQPKIAITDPSQITPVAIGALSATAQAKDSALLAGLVPTDNIAPNTVVVRDGAGDVNARLFKSTYQSQSEIPVGSSLCFRANNTTDNFMRFGDVGAVRNWLGRVNDSTLLAGKTVDAIKTEARSGLVTNTVMINNKSLTGNVTLVAADIGLGNVANFGITSGWNGQATNLYASQKAVYDAAGAPALPIERKRVITYSQAAPSDGAEEGTVWIQW